MTYTQFLQQIKDIHFERQEKILNLLKSSEGGLSCFNFLSKEECDKLVKICNNLLWKENTHG